MDIAIGPWGNSSPNMAFKYDSVGNIRDKRLGSRLVTVSYNGTSNLATQSTDTAGITRTMGHDGRGNVTTLGAMSFVYDFSDQPTSQSGAVAATYRYDGNLKRAKQTIGTTTIYSVYDALGAVAYRDDTSTSTATDFVSIPGATVRLEGSVAKYVFSDHLGSATSETNSSGVNQWTEWYTPYGEKISDPTGNKDMPGFTNHIQDDATGLTYMQARFQDPVIGRFLAIDPVGFTPAQPFMFNRYAYAANDPINSTDPTGKEIRLQSHSVAFGQNHSKLVIIPNDQSSFEGDPRFSNRTKDDRIFATIGAASERGAPPFGDLVSNVNRKTDVNKPSNFDVELTHPGIEDGTLSENDVIEALFEADSTFDDDTVNYDAYPSEDSDGYNSNGYVSGLTRAVGFENVPTPPSTPGFDKPVPIERFREDEKL